MLSEQDVAEIRKLKDDLDRQAADLRAAVRETEHAKSRLRQVKTSIRRAARTRFTTWLTNSDPEEYRRYRAAIADHKAQQQLAKELKPMVAARDARITAAVEACLARSDRDYQGIMTQHRKATDDLESCGRLRARSATVRGQVNAALTQIGQLRDRDAKDARKAMDVTTAHITDAVHTLKHELTALAPRMRTYGSFPVKHVQNLRAEFSGRRADLQTRHAQLTGTHATLGMIDDALGSVGNAINKHRRELDKKRSAMVRNARTEVLGS